MLPNSEPQNNPASAQSTETAQAEPMLTQSQDPSLLKHQEPAAFSAHSERQAAFYGLLGREQQLAAQLQQLLADELATMAQDFLSDHSRQHQLAQLGKLNQQKNTLISRLKKQSQQRIDWMKNEQLPLSNACIDDPEFARQPEITALWQQLAADYQHNQQLAATLSELVLSARKRTLKQLNILRGKQNDPHLYSAQGKTHELQPGHGYIQA